MVGVGAGAQRVLNASRSLPKIDPSAGLATRPSGRSSPRERRELAQQVLLLGVEPGGGLHHGVHDDVATAVAAQVGDPEPAQRDRVARLGAAPDVEVAGTVEGVHGEGGAQGGGGHRHLDGGVQVVAAALEDGVPVDGHLDVEVTGRPGAVADLALAGELDAGTGVDTGRDLEGERAAGAHPAVAGALVAGVGDDLCRSPGRSCTGGWS